ncbi:MAG: hypothetical protein ACI9S8_002616 [Chlamydiales bacterium]|jgi:hypothetical protein
MDLRSGFGILSDFVRGLMELLASLIALSVLVQVLFGGAFYGVDVVASLIKLISSFGEAGFSGLVALLILLGLMK